MLDPNGILVENLQASGLSGKSQELCPGTFWRFFTASCWAALFVLAEGTNPSIPSIGWTRNFQGDI